MIFGLASSIHRFSLPLSPSSFSLPLSPSSFPLPLFSFLFPPFSFSLSLLLLMDHRKYERLRGKAANIFEETSSLKSRLSFCRRHFLSVSSSRSPFLQQQRQVSAPKMTMSLAVAAAPLFVFTDRQATNLWAASMQTSSAEENDLQCLENFIQAIDEDLEFVIKVCICSIAVVEVLYAPAHSMHAIGFLCTTSRRVCQSTLSNHFIFSWWRKA